MRNVLIAVWVGGAGLACGAAPAADDGPLASASAPLCDKLPTDLGREILPPYDGWAALGGVTGGVLAAPEQVYIVHTRAELIAALNNGVPLPASSATPSNEPKIIYIEGTIDFNVDDAGKPLACEDYGRDGFTREQFLATYEPTLWGRVAPTGPLETARLTSRNAQQDRVRMRVGSNTTLVGRGNGARLRGVWLDLRGTVNVAGSRTNIIIRNLTFQDTYDCFPQWSPTDGALGSWNAIYDSISLRDTDHVWIDSNTLEDRVTADSKLPTYFGTLFQVHDGLLDITNASDLVTVSWNRFRNHSKVMLIGSSDTATTDRGKLRVTLHHNLFDAVEQRAPRVRFGQVHVYNNYYKVERLLNYVYSWGVGVESAIYAQNNFFKTDRTVAKERFIARYGGTTIADEGTFLNGTPSKNLVDLIGAWNGANDPDLSEAVGFTPTLVRGLQPTGEVPAAVQDCAGALQ